MRVSINVGSDVLSAPVPPIAVADQAVAAEAAGFPAVWTTHFTRGTDSFPTIAVAGARTSSVELGIGIVPTYPRHPYAMAHEAATVQSLVGGRLTLGVGVSHRPVMEGMLGFSFDNPVEHLREYLQVLGPLLTTGAVSHHGPRYDVEASFAVVGFSPVSVVVGALGPRMVKAAGELSDGVVTWLAGPRGLAVSIVPALTEAAAAAGRSAPRVVAGLPVAVCDDAAAGRAAAVETFARYGGLENYQRQFERERVDSVADLAICGPEDHVLARLCSLRDAGATELWAVPFPVGADASESTARTTAFLASLAPDL